MTKPKVVYESPEFKYWVEFESSDYKDHWIADGSYLSLEEAMEKVRSNEDIGYRSRVLEL